MRDITARFLAALRTSHRVVSRVDLLLAGETVAEDLAVIGGRVDYDTSALALARLSLDLAEPTRLPTGPDAQLTPYGYELAVSRGIRYLDGTEELVPLGVFPIQTSHVDGVTLLTSITALDRSQRVSDNRYEEDYQIASGTNVATALAAALEERYPGGTYTFATTTLTTPLLTFPAQDDPWPHFQKMARSIGCELYFDGLGQRVLRPVPDVRTATPVWDVDEGEDGVLTDVALDLDRATAYNKWVVTGENASLASVPRGEAIDDDPASPSYYYGPFGRKPRFYASSFIASDEQATTAARGSLLSSLGIARSIDFAAIPNPALEVWDPLRIRRAVLSLDEVHIPDALSIGLGPEDDMTARSRSRQEHASD